MSNSLGRKVLMKISIPILTPLKMFLNVMKTIAFKEIELHLLTKDKVLRTYKETNLKHTIIVLSHMHDCGETSESNFIKTIPSHTSCLLLILFTAVRNGTCATHLAVCTGITSYFSCWLPSNYFCILCFALQALISVMFLCLFITC